ncbi:hypothetical protein [Streptomyces sp. NL15-2K]|uniref:hypothetical protein n=1 Tax=Streptomyces sp. NL15-2K TaxID=376149 RepID=UPI000F560644|nr:MULTISPECIES: hypothetical protein [Actinomycetes]WKX11259.1 hypothetical protein Q4V64_28570 [Kutzneria buriramensis]GCB47325.1 hypothetical protein SNL152K_4629 [Streptomyces sp. NL15-2K]
MFDTLYEDEPPTGDSQEARNLASGESEIASPGDLPSGEMTGEQGPPSGAAEALRLAPLVEEWWEAGAGSAQIRAALTDGLPRRLYSAAAIVENRLQRKRPSGAGAPEPVTTVEAELRRPGAAAYREAAWRAAGGGIARALPRGQAAPA